MEAEDEVDVVEAFIIVNHCSVTYGSLWLPALKRSKYLERGS